MIADSNWKLQIEENTDTCKSYRIYRNRLTFFHLLFNSLVSVIWLVIAVYIGYHLVAESSEETYIFHQELVFTSVFVGLCIIMLMRGLQSMHTCEESVLVSQGFGVQVTITKSSGSTSLSFYPIQNIHSIVINEGISMVCVSSYILYYII
ncbi:hypothetical protein EB796_008028 [Bugula neritina]|uniref:Phosphatidylinositol N-acetylglucosaminyltransferase subunit H conserved domain-containing protein n=1 Tax=Bugula neritina TaxID=10212 RepID=A0A7J7K7X5_BUGNE|nr:hypothetical protein EB796_008028 [Bugula neritina]